MALTDKSIQELSRETAQGSVVNVASARQLEPHDFVPHFDVTTIDGGRARYADLWQHKNLVLVVIGASQLQDAGRYVSSLQARLDDFAGANTTLIVTSSVLPGIRAPSVVVA